MLKVSNLAELLPRLDRRQGEPLLSEQARTRGHRDRPGRNGGDERRGHRGVEPDRTAPGADDRDAGADAGRHVQRTDQHGPGGARASGIPALTVWNPTATPPTLSASQAGWINRQIGFDLVNDSTTTAGANYTTNQFLLGLQGLDIGTSVCPERLIPDPCATDTKCFDSHGGQRRRGRRHGPRTAELPGRRLAVSARPRHDLHVGGERLSDRAAAARHARSSATVAKTSSSSSWRCSTSTGRPRPGPPRRPTSASSRPTRATRRRPARRTAPTPTSRSSRRSSRRTS